MNSTFIKAVKRGDYKKLRKLYIQGCDPSQFQNWALDYSCEHGYTKTVKFLISTPEVAGTLDPLILLLMRIRE